MLFFHYPLGMGVSVVLHHVANQTHTSSPHFASFPYGLPNHRFMVMFFFTCNSAGSWTHHFIHHQFAHLRTYLHFTYLIQKLANGALTLHQFSWHFCLPWGIHFTLGHPFLYFVHFSPFIFREQTPVVTNHCFCRHHRRPTLATRNPCHPWLEYPFSVSLVDIVHIFRA